MYWALFMYQILYVQWSNYLIFTNTCEIIGIPFIDEAGRVIDISRLTLRAERTGPIVCSTYSLVCHVTSFQEILNPRTHGKLQITSTLQVKSWLITLGDVEQTSLEWLALEYNLLFPVSALIWLILQFPNVSVVLCHLINGWTLTHCVLHWSHARNFWQLWGTWSQRASLSVLGN